MKKNNLLEKKLFAEQKIAEQLEFLLLQDPKNRNIKTALNKTQDNILFYELRLKDKRLIHKRERERQGRVYRYYYVFKNNKETRINTLKELLSMYKREPNDTYILKERYVGNKIINGVKKTQATLTHEWFENYL